MCVHLRDFFHFFLGYYDELSGYYRAFGLNLTSLFFMLLFGWFINVESNVGIELDVAKPPVANAEFLMNCLLSIT